MFLLLKFFLCGVLTSFLFPPFFLTPIGFLIFPYLVYLLNANKKILNYKSHFFVGFLYGLGFFSFFLLWLKEPFLLDVNTEKYAFFSYALIFYCSIYFGFIFFIIKFFKRFLFKILLLPTLIVLSEFMCSNFLYGFPWFSFALINSNNSLGTTLIFYLGSYGLSYISILIFLLPSTFLLINKKDKIILYLIASILFIFILLLFLMKNFTDKDIKTESFSVLIAQLNYSSNQHLSLAEKNTKLKKITEVISNYDSEIIIFSENEFPYLMDKKSINFLQSKLRDNQKLIIGSTREQSLQFYNSLYLIHKNYYKKFDKKILVPFGEFIPLRSYFGFMDFIAGSFDFSRGSDERHLRLEENYNILPVICYEIVYFWKLLQANNTNIIINITNDSWFGDFLGPYQHFYFTKLRAAEFNKPIIRVSSNGVSGLIDDNGSIKSFIKLNKNGLMKMEVIKSGIKKNYLLFHKFFFLIIIFSLLIFLFLNKKDE